MNGKYVEVEKMKKMAVYSQQYLQNNRSVDPVFLPFPGREPEETL